MAGNEAILDRVFPIPAEDADTAEAEGQIYVKADEAARQAMLLPMHQVLALDVSEIDFSAFGEFKRPEA